ncbi:MAG TPA: lipid-A-disaccharide synthase, partial [Caulobacteraceae bacterium]
ILKDGIPKLEIAVVAAETVADQVKAAVAGWPFRVHLVEGEGAKRDAMKASTAALACSGTVSIELALAGTPMVIAYRLGWLSFAIMSRVIKPPYITLFNIAAGREAAPEFLQDKAVPMDMAKAVALPIMFPEERARQVEAQYAALEALGRPERDPSEAAAEAVIRVLETGAISRAG